MFEEVWNRLEIAGFLGGDNDDDTSEMLSLVGHGTHCSHLFIFSVKSFM